MQALGEGVDVHIFFGSHAGRGLFALHRERKRLVTDSICPHSGVAYLHVDVGVGDNSGRLEAIGQGVRPLLDLPVGEV